MRTDEERIAALHERAVVIEREKRNRRVFAGQTLSAAACFVFVIALAIVMPDMVSAITPAAVSGSMSASIFSGSGALGIIVTGVVSFALGVAVTIFCFRLKKWKDEKDRESEIGTKQDNGS